MGREEKRLEELNEKYAKKLDKIYDDLSPNAKNRLKYQNKLKRKNEEKHKAFLICCILASLALGIALQLFGEKLEFVTNILDKIELPYFFLSFAPVVLPIVVLILRGLIRGIKKAIRSAKINSINKEDEIKEYRNNERALHNEHQQEIYKLEAANQDEETRLKKEYEAIKRQMKPYAYKNHLLFYFDLAPSHSYQLYLDGQLYESFSRRQYLDIKLNPGIHSFRIESIYNGDFYREEVYPTQQVDTEDCPVFYTCKCDYFDRNAEQKEVSLEQFERISGKELAIK